MEIRALTFDVFGTVVDWRSGVAREVEALLAPKGLTRDWGALADAWRARYYPAMAKVASGERPFVILDALHRENLVELLKAEGIDGLSEAEIDHLNRAWHRLDPWPDVVTALARLKDQFIVAAHSNGNIELMVVLTRRGGLVWDVILGAEVTRAYKPSPEAYDGTARMLGLQPAECLMVACHPSDLRAAAVRRFRTAYIHRPLERGPVREAPWPGEAEFDYRAADFNALAASLAATLSM